MTFSIKKIFVKSEEKTNEEQAQNVNTEDNSAKEDRGDKKNKHDTPSGCCGSCT